MTIRTLRLPRVKYLLRYKYVVLLDNLQSKWHVTETAAVAVTKDTTAGSTVYRAPPQASRPEVEEAYFVGLGTPFFYVQNAQCFSVHF